MIATDYTKKSENTLCGAPLTRYRFANWLCDLMRNFMSDPLNIPDERLARLLFVQDGRGHDECRALFQVALPYSMDSRKAGTSPALLVSAGEGKFQLAPILNGYSSATQTAGVVERRMALYTVTGKIAVVTETLPGTLLLSDTIEEFFITNKREIETEGMLTQLNLLSASEVQEIRAAEGGNAKPLYQSVIMLSAVGSVSWSSDTQGPVFRGTRVQSSVSN